MELFNALRECLPERVVGNGGFDGDGLLGDGVDELHTTGHQRDAAIGVGTWGSVLKVTLDGTTHRCQLTTDLMVTACHKMDFKECVVVGVGEGTVFQDGFLGVWLLRWIGVGFVLLFVADEPVLQRVPLTIVAELFTFHSYLFTSHNRPIGLVDLALGKHLVQTREGFRGACEDDQSADGTIQAMYDAEEHGPRLRVLLLDIVLHNIREGAVASLVALNDLPTLFIDDDNMVVLVNDLHTVNRKL